MGPIDLHQINKRSPGAENAHLARLAELPRCSRLFTINKGPTLPAICGAPANEVPGYLSDALKLERRNVECQSLIDSHIPLQFTLHSGFTEFEREQTFPVAVFVRSIDLAPDLEQVNWSLRGETLSSREDRNNAEILVVGWFFTLTKNEDVPKDLRKDKSLRKCIIRYNPRRGEGTLGEVDLTHESAQSGVVKGVEGLHKIVGSHFVGGFIEKNMPDGKTYWARISGGHHGIHICCDAVREYVPEHCFKWRYAEQRNFFHMPILGAWYDSGRGYNLVGDTVLCADGTMLISTYFTRKKWENLNLSADWKDGYYIERLYPAGSPMIPKEISNSFGKEMPVWFYKEHLKESALA